MNPRTALNDRLAHLARSVPGLLLLPPTSAAAAAGDEEEELCVQCDEAVWAALTEALAGAGEVAHVVVPDTGLLGLVLRDGTFALLRRAGVESRALPDSDLGAAAARFWFSLLRLTARAAQDQSFSAHAHLEAARSALLGLYRLALGFATPRGGESAWLGLETRNGARFLDPLAEWLVCPLDVRAQRRCGLRLAETYERITLTMFERLQIPYPWDLRNLAFARLDRLRTPVQAAGAEGGLVEALQGPDSANPPEPSPRAAPARFRIKRKGQP